jgi:hypothetical protein
MKKQKIRGNLKINTLEGKLKYNRIRQYEHILRMNKEKIPKKVLNMKVLKRETKIKKGTTG